MDKKIKCVGVLTSGGDSPGMNCAIRAVVRSCIHQGLRVFGIKRGYAGLLASDIFEMNASSVGNIIQRGGTILQTSRCPEFLEKSSRAQAFENLKKQGIDSLVVIGGDGSFQGAYALHQETGLSIAGIPGTIDNDISGTDYTIGFDTAVQTAIEAVDRIRDTASSHARNFLVEVMGRNSSAIAAMVGVCTGAENIVFPDSTVSFSDIVEDIQRGIQRGKDSSIIIVAEGPVAGRSYKIGKTLEEKYQVSSKICILGHVQRGGSPTAVDRYTASEMGFQAVKALVDSDQPMVAVSRKGVVQLAPFTECLEKTNHIGQNFLELAKTLSI